MKLEPWQKLVMEELFQLQARKQELAQYCDSATYRTLDEATRYLISAQFSAMETYEKILKMRVKLWEAQSCR